MIIGNMDIAELIEMVFPNKQHLQNTPGVTL